MAAGMTGGLGYFYDEEGDFEDKVPNDLLARNTVGSFEHALDE